MSQTTTLNLRQPDGIRGIHDHTDHDDVEVVSRLIGRPVRCTFDVVVRDASGVPMVIRNAPLLDDGTPMPTRWWLTSTELCEAVSRLEARGGVRLAAAAVDPLELAQAHQRYADERSQALPKGHPGPLPSGGVGGTRVGVKCLHAHLAWYLAGGDDPVGQWVADQIGTSRSFSHNGLTGQPERVLTADNDVQDVQAP
ncbi:MAG: DUF501 domain-containing protein [Actinomycetota bacterium]|jgi:hypothetical protein|nr:DUF501 domain-containing protein [Actinomycetota bacterium]